jgi:1-acyl-sn-glycerol-3-phosphate acyltransferase
MDGSFRVSAGVKFKRWLLRFIFRPIFRLLFRIRITGQENVPRGSAYIIAANHISLFEPPLLLAFWPELPEVVAGHDVWDRPGQNILVKGYGALPVHRGEYDRYVIESMLAVLQSGRPLLIFPEGGRSHELGMRRALPGVAYLVDKAQTPVLPVAITGTRDDLLKGLLRLKRNRLEIRIGEPFRLAPIEAKGEARREARQTNADEVMLRIAAMLPEEYHGVYAGQVPVQFRQIDD